MPTWTSINKKAVDIEKALSSDDSLLEREFARLSLGPNSAPGPPADPNATEIDAFQRNNSQGCFRGPAHGASGATQAKTPRQDPMRRWTDDGNPICGYCDKVGHLTKKCRNKRTINAVADTPSATINSVRAVPATDHVQYAAIPISDDSHARPTINNFSVVAPLGSAAPALVSTPLIDITLQGRMVKALVDTGANISAIRTSVADSLGLVLDTSRGASFTIANSTNTTSRGIVSVPTMVGTLHSVLEYHMVDNLSQLVILLSSLKVIRRYHQHQNR